MPAPTYDALCWTTIGMATPGKRLAGPTLVTLHARLSGQGNTAHQEEQVKRARGYKLAFRVKTNQSVDFQFLDDAGQPFALTPDTQGAQDLQQLFPAPGEQWAAFVSAPNQHRGADYLHGRHGLRVEYHGRISVVPLTGPQAILCAHAYADERYTVHHLLSALVVK